MSRFLYLLVLLCFCSCLKAEGKAPTEKLVSAIAINQNCKIVGEADIFISDEGLKCYCRSKDLTFLVTPPFKEVVVYCKQSKKIFHSQGGGLSLSFFDQVIAVTGFNFGDAQIMPAGQKIVAGHTALYYRSTSDYNRKLKDRISRGEFISRSATSLRFCYLDDLKIDRHYSNFIASLFSLPKAHGLPVRVVFTRPQGDEATYLETSHIVSTRIAADQFVVPQGFKTVSAMQDMLTGQQEGNGLDFFK